MSFSSLPEDIKDRARQIVWTDEASVVVLASCPDSSAESDCLSGFRVGPDRQATLVWRVSTKSSLMRMAVDETTGRLFLEDASGHLFEGNLRPVLPLVRQILRSFLCLHEFGATASTSTIRSRLMLGWIEPILSRLYEEI
jgi:hypothetical protein